MSFLVTVRGFDNLEREIPVFGRGGIRVSSLLSLIDGQPFAEWLTEQIAEGGLGVSDPTGGGVASIVNIQVITK